MATTARKGSLQRSEWVTTTALHEETLGGRTEEVLVLRELPAKPTHRQNSEHQVTAAQQVSGHLLQAFKSNLPHLEPSAVKEQRALQSARLHLACSTWRAFNSACEAGQQALEVESFTRMDLFAGYTMAKLHSTKDHLVPAAMLSTRGPVTGDHLQTFHHFQAYMKDQLNAYTVMLQPRHFQQGLGTVLTEVLTQLAGKAGAEDMHALYQWYEDQTGWAATSDPGPAPAASSQPIAEAAGVRAGAGGPAGASLTPSSATGPQANTAEPPGGEEDEEATAATTPAPSAVGKRGGRGGKTPGGKTPGGRAPGGKTPGTAGRVLRTRKPLQPLPGQQRLLSHVAAQQAANRARPLVLIVQSAEEVGSPALKDLLGALLLDYSRFPACLVLCCCKPAPLFLAGLPEACRARLAPQVLLLPSQEERLERLFQDLLGSSQASPCVLLSQRPLRAALQRYEHLGAGVQGLLAALQAAHVRHWAEQPLAGLAAAALTHSAGPPPSTTTAATTTAPSTLAASTAQPDPHSNPAGSRGAVAAAQPAPLAQLQQATGEVEQQQAAAGPGLRGSGAPEGVLAAPPAAPPPLGQALEAALQQLPDSLVLQAGQQVFRSAAPGRPLPALLLGSGAGGWGADQAAPPSPSQGPLSPRSPGSSPGRRSPQGGRRARQARQAAVATARGLVLAASSQAVQVLALWRLGLQWAATVARAAAGGGGAGGGCGSPLPQLRLAALYLAASSPGFWIPVRVAAALPVSPGQQLVAALTGPSSPWSVARLPPGPPLTALLQALREQAQASHQALPQPLLEQLIAQLDGCIAELSSGQPWSPACLAPGALDPLLLPVDQPLATALAALAPASPAAAAAAGQGGGGDGRSPSIMGQTGLSPMVRQLGQLDAHLRSPTTARKLALAAAPGLQPSPASLLAREMQTASLNSPGGRARRQAAAIAAAIEEAAAQQPMVPASPRPPRPPPRAPAGSPLPANRHSHPGASSQQQGAGPQHDVLHQHQQQPAELVGVGPCPPLAAAPPGQVAAQPRSLSASGSLAALGPAPLPSPLHAPTQPTSSLGVSRAARKLQLTSATLAHSQATQPQAQPQASQAARPGAGRQGEGTQEASSGVTQPQQEPGQQELGRNSQQQQQQGGVGRDGQQQVQQAAGPGLARAPLGVRLAAFLGHCLQLLLQRTPFHLPGSPMFTYHDAAALEDCCLLPQPRAALHHALISPSAYLGSGLVDDANPLSTDVEIVYQRLLGQDTALVHAWFDDFCEVMLQQPPLPPDSPEGKPGQLPGKAQRRAGQGARARARGALAAASDSEEGEGGSEGGGDSDGEGDSSSEAEEAGARGVRGGRGGRGGRGRGRGAAGGRGRAGTANHSMASNGPKAGKQAASQVKRGSAALDGGADDDLHTRVLYWAARFSQAVAELEHLGIIRPAKRRKQQAVQRVFHPPEAMLATFGLAD